MLSIENHDECTGCMACLNICPRQAIYVEEDEKGFSYPLINKERCIECGLCNKVCEIRESFKDKPIACYAAKHKNEEVLLKSSSGGMFTALSDYILADGGVVIAAFYDYEKHCLSHKATDESLIRDGMRGSKYVQSDIGTAYEDVVKNLSAGRKVLFIGTPCQCAGLQSYCKVKHIESENLYIVDLICHGVSSPKVWREYLRLWEEKNKANIKHITFKDKSTGWTHPSTKVRAGSKTYDMTLFKRVVMGEISFRPSCFSCPYSEPERCSDMTIGDFWGIRNIDPEFFDEKGVSVCLVNTSRGGILLENVKNALDLSEKSLESCCSGNPNLRAHTVKPDTYEKFWRDYQKSGAACVDKWGNKMNFDLLLRKLKIKK